MKKILLFWVLGIGCIISFNSFAVKAMADAKEQQLPAQAQPVQVPPEVKTIFSFKKELGLTDDQEARIKAMLFDAQQSLAPNRAKLEKMSSELNLMIQNKEAITKIRKKLEEVSKIQIDLVCMDIENGRKVETILSPDQFKKWNEIKVRESKK